MPNLDLSALETHIRTKRLAPVYLFVGEDVRLMERMVDGVEGTIDEADRAFAVERLYAGDAGGTPVEIAAAARGLPMLGNRRIVIVLRAERLLKPKRAAKAGEGTEEDEDAASGEDEAALDVAPLDEYLAGPSSSSTLVLVAAEVDKTRRFTKRVLEQAQVVRFAGIRGEPNANAAERRDAKAAAAEWLQGELVRAGRSVDPGAVRVLVDRAGGDISKLRGDVERLLLYTEGQARITAEDADEVAADGATVEDEWAVINAIGAGDVKRALREVVLRLDRGDSPHGLVGQIRWWVSTRLVEGSPERVPAAIEALLKTDLALKSSGGDERVLLERLIIELTGRPVQQQGGWRR